MYSMYKQGNIDHLLQAKEIILTKSQPVTIKPEVDKKLPTDYVKPAQVAQPAKEQVTLTSTVDDFSTKIDNNNKKENRNPTNPLHSFDSSDS